MSTFSLHIEDMDSAIRSALPLVQAIAFILLCSNNAINSTAKGSSHSNRVNKLDKIEKIYSLLEDKEKDDR